jgi:hypothetical protein
MGDSSHPSDSCDSIKSPSSSVSLKMCPRSISLLSVCTDDALSVLEVSGVGNFPRQGHSTEGSHHHHKPSARSRGHETSRALASRQAGSESVRQCGDERANPPAACAAWMLQHPPSLQEGGGKEWGDRRGQTAALFSNAALAVRKRVRLSVAAAVTHADVLRVALRILWRSKLDLGILRAIRCLFLSRTLHPSSRRCQTAALTENESAPFRPKPGGSSRRCRESRQARVTSRRQRELGESEFIFLEMYGCQFGIFFHDQWLYI